VLPATEVVASELTLGPWAIARDNRDEKIVRRNLKFQYRFSPMWDCSPGGNLAIAHIGKAISMSTYTHPVPRAIPNVARHLAWFGVVCVVSFLVPYLGVSVLDLQHDVFYFVYFAVTMGLVATYVRVE
jgi:hypothetical protein